jgi:hypothetical protein
VNTFYLAVNLVYRLWCLLPTYDTFDQQYNRYISDQKWHTLSLISSLLFKMEQRS